MLPDSTVRCVSLETLKTLTCPTLSGFTIPYESGGASFVLVGVKGHSSPQEIPVRTAVCDEIQTFRGSSRLYRARFFATNSWFTRNGFTRKTFHHETETSSQTSSMVSNAQNRHDIRKFGKRRNDLGASREFSKYEF